MKLIKARYNIISDIDGIKICKEIEKASRTCYRSEDKITEDSYISLITKIISLGHEAMLEFGGMITVKFICDRGISHELVRHRIASFAQESTRYCNYGKDEHITFIIPNFSTTLQEGVFDDLLGNDFYWHKVDNTETMKLNIVDGRWMSAMNKCEVSYNELIKEGWTPQQARSVLPNSLKTEINISANIREWRHIFKLRCSNAAHPQMRELMIPLLKEFQSKIPILFDNLI
jgi:thymidylate synthase (FAD)